MKTIALLIGVLIINIGSAYVMNDLVQKLNGYSKTWVSGINTKFVNMTL